jgi:hypothetical protein
MATKKNNGIWALALLASAALVIWLILPSRWTDPVWYSIKFWVHSDQVHWTARPTDCDSAKGCHYKKTVVAYNGNGDPVAGDGVPICKHDIHHGSNVISYDAETWSQLPIGTPCPDKMVKNVEIKWTKVED